MILLQSLGNYSLLAHDFDGVPTPWGPPFNTICRILTTGKSQEVGLPRECHEHPSNCYAGQRAVETPETKVDVFKWSCQTESCYGKPRTVRARDNERDVLQ